jgi:hypothetical protein
VPISSVNGPFFQALDRKKIAGYRRALRRGDVFPPIKVTKPRVGLYTIFDGFHRFHAHRLEGRKTIQTMVVDHPYPSLAIWNEGAGFPDSANGI